MSNAEEWEGRGDRKEGEGERKLEGREEGIAEGMGEKEGGSHRSERGGSIAAFVYARRAVCAVQHGRVEVS